MDARVGDWVVTPRIGKPVEINALWYNALRSMAAFARRLGEAPDTYDALAEAASTGLRGSGIRSAATASTSWMARTAVIRRCARTSFSPCRYPRARYRPSNSSRSSTSAPRLHTSYGLRSLTPDAPGIGGTARVTRPRATAPITRAPSGRGYWDHLRWRTCGSIRTRRNACAARADRRSSGGGRVGQCERNLRWRRAVLAQGVRRPGLVGRGDPARLDDHRLRVILMTTPTPQPIQATAEGRASRRSAHWRPALASVGSLPERAPVGHGA